MTWATRSANRRPCVEVASDPLPERERITARANGMAEAPPPFLKMARRASVESISARGGRLDRRAHRRRRAACSTPWSASPAIAPTCRSSPSWPSRSRLPAKGRRGSPAPSATSTDCLSAPAVAARDLQSGEPGFHLIGAKSYGRLPTFLMQAGIGQAAAIVDSLGAA